MRPPHAAPARPVADRGVVLRRSLRPARRPRRPGMDVPPHPHTGLQTVSWLFERRGRAPRQRGVHAMVRPGELNLMTAGAGICHSEVSTAATTCCTACSCGWRCPTPTATPAATSRTTRRSRARSPAPRCGSSSASSPATAPRTHLHPAARRPARPRPGRRPDARRRPGFEHGVLLDQGSVEVDGTALAVADLAFQAAGRDSWRSSTAATARRVSCCSAARRFPSSW